MTDASFVDRMGTDRVIYRANPRRRACEAFQAAALQARMAGRDRYILWQRIAHACLVSYVAMHMLFVVALKVGRVMGAAP